MYVGHYFPAFLAKAVWPDSPLWLLVTAAQLPDIFYFSFIILGIERMSLGPPPKWTFYPYTHALIFTLTETALLYLLLPVLFGVSTTTATAFSLVFFSHWVNDLVQHPDADLPLGFGFTSAFNVTLGLGRHPLFEFWLEIVLVTVSYVYMMVIATELNAGAWLLLPVLIAIQWKGLSFPVANTSQFAAIALFVYTLVIVSAAALT